MHTTDRTVKVSIEIIKMFKARPYFRCIANRVTHILMPHYLDTPHQGAHPLGHNNGKLKEYSETFTLQSNFN